MIGDFVFPELKPVDLPIPVITERLIPGPNIVWYGSLEDHEGGILMPVLHLNLEGDGVWSDVDPSKIIHHETEAIHVCTLEAGMAAGSPIVGIRIDLPDGTHVVAETSMALFVSAARAMVAKHGEP